MEDWDQETLEKVVASKSNEYNKNKPTDIVSLHYSIHYLYFTVTIFGVNASVLLSSVFYPSLLIIVVVVVYRNCKSYGR